MVQYKRKPVKPEPLPPNIDDNTEVWVIEATGEVFTDYEKFLNRRDFYQQRIFTCESTGHSGYTFFEAMESEQEAAEEIDSIFPEGLRSRVLNFVQFRTTSRMDDLVNHVYDYFRDHYMVGDRVAVDTDAGKRYGVIKNMTDTSRLHSMFNGQIHDEGFRSYTYIMQMEPNGEELTRYKASELQRDRRVYSKLILKQFLRNSTSREPWVGAPWMVKDHLAKRYDIPTKMSEARSREAAMAAKKAANAAHMNGTSMPPNMPPHPGHPHQQMNGVRPPLQENGPRRNDMHAYPANQHHMHMNASHPPYPYPGPIQMQYNGPPLMQYNGPPPIQFHNPPPGVTAVHQLPPNHNQQVSPTGTGLPIGLPFQHNFMQYQTLAPTNAPQPQAQHSAPPAPRPFEPIKYPIEDLRIKQPRVTVTRPPLKFLSDDVPEGVESLSEDDKKGILMKSIGPLLTIWETLNVHDTIYSLDSFTIDDFVEAIGFSSDEVECELLVEAHCAVLKQYVSDSGKLQIELPSMTDDEEEDEEEDEESSKESTPEPEPPVRTTRSSLRKSEASQIVVQQRTPTPEPPKELHRAPEFLEDFDWVEQCKIRNFREGGWQAILVGVLYQLSFKPSNKDACDEILAELVPPDEEPSVENIAVNYENLDVNLRISALDIALRLTATTEQFREQLQVAAQEMTTLRKEKIDFQRKRRELSDELLKLDIERKIQLPLNTPASPTEAKDSPDVSMTDLNEKEEAEEEEDSEAPAATRKMRNAAKQTKRKRESEVARKEKAKKAKAEAAKTKQQKDWEKLLDAIEKKKEELRSCEASINELDDDLREALVHRSKILGKDRFLNKYYWFEHNGMPFGGVPTSSTADYGYANGRIWVQGPDPLEFQPNMEEPCLSQDMAEFGWTVPMRKEREEGSTHLADSGEWGYYDDPEDIGKLMAWLDERGSREKLLRKELMLFQDRISEYMVKMKDAVEGVDKSESEDEEPVTRVSTRQKANAEKANGETQPKCLLWTNSIMRDREGYNHAEEYEPPKRTRKATAKATKGKGKK